MVKREGPGIKQLTVAIEAVNNLSLQVGWFEGAKYPDGTPVAYVATINEYGYPEGGIPPRSFMRTTITERKRAWADLAKSGNRAVLAGNTTPRLVLTGLGLAAAADIKKKIVSINSPPLKAATIAARMRKLAKGKKVGLLTKPLIETENMLTTLTHSVMQK